MGGLLPPLGKNQSPLPPMFSVALRHPTRTTCAVQCMVPGFPPRVGPHMGSLGGRGTTVA